LKGDDGFTTKYNSTFQRVDGSGTSDSAKNSSSSRHALANNGAEISLEETEMLRCCGGGGLSDADKATADILPYFAEAERLSSLRSLEMIDKTPESRFDSITFIMKAVFQVPISAITLIEDDTIHFHSRAGEWAKTAPRHGSFCDRILEGAAPRMLVVEDASLDTRFNKNKYVVGYPQIRFYAGSPLVGSQGHRYGTLCVIDTKPRRFTAEQYLLLCHFAELATRELERDKLMKDDHSELKNALRGAKSATGQVLRAMDALNEAVLLTDVSQPDWPVVYCNDAWSKATGSDPDVGRASSSTSSGASGNHTSNGNIDESTGPLQPLAPFWHIFKGKAIDPSAVATAMAAARLGQAFTLSVRSTVHRDEVINLRFKPVSEPGRLGAAAMPQIAVPAGIGLDWMLQGNIDGNNDTAPAAAPRLGRAFTEPISADLNNSKRAELAAALSVLSGNPLAEPHNNSIEKAAAAATAAAAAVAQQEDEAQGSLLPEPIYYLGVVLNQGPPPPPPRQFPTSPFEHYGESTEIVVGGGGRDTKNLSASNSGNVDDDLDAYSRSYSAGLGTRGSGPLSSRSDTRSEGPTQHELQAAAQLACAAPVWDSVHSENSLASTTTGASGAPTSPLDQPTTKPDTTAAGKHTPIQALLGTARTSMEVQSSSGAWGLIDRPPPLLQDTILGALVGSGTNSRCYRGVWKQKQRVAVKVADLWRESYDSSATIFTLPLSELPSHPNLVSVLASAVITTPTGVPNRTHLEVWTVEEFCNRGQLGDAIECGNIHGASFIHRPLAPPPPTANSTSISNGGDGVSGGGSPPRPYDLRAILQTAHDVASAMAVLHSTGTIHGALTSNNVLLTADPTDSYRGWKALVGDYALVASEAALSGGSKNCNTSALTFHGYSNYYSTEQQQQQQDEEHPLLKFRGTTVRAMNRPPCAAHIPPDVLLGASLTPASDVYSFGVIFWELLSSRRAWRTLKTPEVVMAVAVEGYRLPTEIAGVPKPVLDLMQKCLSEDVAMRPDFNEVEQTLKQLQITLS
jgi:serine/threonine protein kinase